MVEDAEIIAAQLAELTRTVEQTAKQLGTVRERADTQQERIKAGLVVITHRW